MAERVAGLTAGLAADLAECPARHCWVVAGLDRAKRPALLTEWRRDAAGEWQGRVVYLAKLRPGEDWTLVEEWVPAACLLPA